MASVWLVGGWFHRGGVASTRGSGSFLEEANGDLVLRLILLRRKFRNLPVSLGRGKTGPCK